jgi:hypothetical protein
MSTRTFSLLMLFLIALAVSALLVAMLQPLALRLELSTPWLVPLVGVLSYSATFFLGRRYILPGQIAHAPALAIGTVVLLTTLSLVLVWVIISLIQALGGGIPGGLALILWFVALWVAVGALHRTSRHQQLPLL